MKSSLSDLQKFIDQHEIPRVKGRPKTFLGIAKQPHYENVLSNIYAFYFNVKEVHGLKDLFITSLCDIIKSSILGPQKSALNNFTEFSAETEYGTVKGGRIDLLLHNETQAIIVENKVYHHLNNDLNDYWKTIEVPSKNKVGIVLSLNHVSKIIHSEFINITHLDFLHRVMENIGPYLLDAQEKYVVFLKDLFQNIINLSRSFMNEKELNFYYRNQNEINQLEKFKHSVNQHIISEVEKAGQILENFNLLAPRANSSNENRLRYYASPQHRDLMITIVFEGLLKVENSMYIAVELTGSSLKNKKQYNSIIFNSEEQEILNIEFINSKENWAHFTRNDYHLKTDEVARLSEFILRKLEEDKILSVFKKLDAYLEQKSFQAENFK